MPTSLLIADAHPVVLYALTDTMTAVKGMRLVGTATSVIQVISRCQLDHPAILILDATLPDGSLIDTVDKVRDLSPKTKIVVFSAVIDPEAVYALFSRGIEGYVLKESPLPTIVDAILQVQQGGVWYSPPITRLLINFVSGRNADVDETFSEREQAVLVHLVAGQSDHEIAAALDIKVTTVRYHLGKLFERLGLRSRVDLAVQAVQKGWIKGALTD